MKDKTAGELAAEWPDIGAWLSTHREAFYRALGLRPFDDALMVLVLAKVRELFGGRFPMLKDDIDRYRCDTLRAFLDGHKVPDSDLAAAIALMMQSYNGAVERIYHLERRVMQPPHAPRPTPRPVRR